MMLIIYGYTVCFHKEQASDQITIKEATDRPDQYEQECRKLCTDVMGFASLADNQKLFTGINVIGTNVIKYKFQRPRIVLFRMT